MQIALSCVENIFYLQGIKTRRSGSYCSEVEASKNIEFTCLQEKYEEMRDSDSLHDNECADMVAELTGIASQELDLEQVLFAACEPMVERFCASVVKQEDEGQVLGCLISHKNEEEMDEKCRAGVFHFQIISLSDYKLSYSFFKCEFSDTQRAKLLLRNLRFILRPFTNQGSGVAFATCYPENEIEHSQDNGYRIKAVALGHLKAVAYECTKGVARFLAGRIGRTKPVAQFL